MSPWWCVNGTVNNQQLPVGWIFSCQSHRTREVKLAESCWVKTGWTYSKGSSGWWSAGGPFFDVSPFVGIWIISRPPNLLLACRLNGIVVGFIRLIHGTRPVFIPKNVEMMILIWCKREFWLWHLSLSSRYWIRVHFFRQTVAGNWAKKIEWLYVNSAKNIFYHTSKWIWIEGGGCLFQTTGGSWGGALLSTLKLWIEKLIFMIYFHSWKRPQTNVLV